MSNAKSTPLIQSLDRGLALLQAVGAAGGPVSLAELNAVLRIDRSSVFRLANTLERRGFLAQAVDTKRYTLGPAIWLLAGQMRRSNPLPQLAREHVTALAAETGETAHLAIREQDRAAFVEHELTDQAVGVSSGSGRAEPLHCTALGKALIADLDRDGLREVFGRRRLVAFTKRTIVSIAGLLRECERTAARGYAVDDEEFHDGVRCVAAPIRDSHGDVVAAIGISAPANRLPKRSFSALGRQVRRAADEVSAKLGYAPSPQQGTSSSTNTVRRKAPPRRRVRR